MPFSNFKFHPFKGKSVDGCPPLTASIDLSHPAEDRTVETDYSFLYEEYPEIISADQLYRICHISKRKAKWLLDSGHVPCQDSGKKTRCYKIRIDDVVTYLRTLETAPETVAAPVGLFNSKKKHTNPIAQISIDDFQRFLYEIWWEVPDALTPKDVRSLIGYSANAIGQWMIKQKLQSTILPDRTQIIAKQWLVEFVSEYTIHNPGRLSKVNRQIVQQYLEQQ